MDSRREQYIKEFESIFRVFNRRFLREMNQIFGDRLSYSEFLYLKFLDQKGSQMVSALSEEFSVSVSHITAVMNTLVSEGYVNRVRSEQDRRVVELTITEEGKRLITELDSVKDVHMRNSFEPLSTEEIAQLLALYQKLSTKNPSQS
ncbi:MarR family transcriptional regulator [Brevibacillus fluminis]|uniref:MarR family transcriptional regulator n=2 Tax=Brevibacillus fluminis TaxID=511487 RepID=A0A3M8DGV8_9BACL|nr:MarR family transcriptional regulator [Brevibacillus fluminis]